MKDYSTSYFESKDSEDTSFLLHKTHKDSLYIHTRVHKKEKRVSNCAMSVHKHPFWSTKYTCVYMFNTTLTHQNTSTEVRQVTLQLSKQLDIYSFIM